MNSKRKPGPRRSSGIVLALALAILGSPLAAQEPYAAVDAVRDALARGDAATALTLAVAAANAAPDSPLALTWLGHAHRLAGNPAEAAMAYQAAIRLDPEAGEALMGLGEVQRDAGDLRGAAASFDRAAAAAPDNPAPQRAAGTVWMQMTQYTTAARHFARYLSLRPGDLDVIYLSGVSNWLAGEHEAAIEVLERGLADAPASVPLQYALGVVLADRPDDHDRALELLAAAEDGGWEIADSAYLTGRILAGRGEHQAAADALRRSLEVSPEKLDAWYRLSQSLARLGRRDEARAAMQRFSTLQREVNDADHRAKQVKSLRNDLAAALVANDLEGADAILGELLTEMPDDPDTLVQAAKLWISMGRVTDALDAATAAAQIAPEHWEARYVEGVILMASGRAEAALRALEAARRANPLFADTYNMIGNSLMLLERPGPAVDAYLAATELETDNPGYYDNLAAACAAAGRPDLEAEARATAERLRQMPSTER